MEMADKIRILRIKCGNLTEMELAEKMGTSRQNLNDKIQRDNFKVNELEKIANAVGAELVIKFVLPNGDEV